MCVVFSLGQPESIYFNDARERVKFLVIRFIDLIMLRFSKQIYGPGFFCIVSADIMNMKYET